MHKSILRGVALLSILAGAFPATRANAQGVEDPPTALALPAWRISVAGGVMTEPVAAGEPGAAAVVDVGRRLGTQARLVALGIAFRTSYRGVSPQGSYDLDREWLIAAVGIESAVARTPRLDATVGVAGGAKWSRTKRLAWIGAPPPGEPATRSQNDWDEGAVLIPSVQAAYRLAGPLALSARLASVTHIFTDNMVGNSGVLFTLGAALAW